MTINSLCTGCGAKKTDISKMSDNQPSSEAIYAGKFMGCNLIITKDAGLHHLSISRKDRLPSYDELKSAIPISTRDPLHGANLPAARGLRKRPSILPAPLGTSTGLYVLRTGNAMTDIPQPPTNQDPRQTLAERLGETIDRHTLEWKAGHNHLIVEQVMRLADTYTAALLPVAPPDVKALVRDIMQVPYSKQKAEQLVAAYVHDQEVNARIDELSHVQLEYGHRVAQTFVDGEALTVEERIAELQARHKED